MSYEGPIKRQRMNDGNMKEEFVGDHEQNKSFGDQQPEQPNKVLLFTVINPVYPITTEVIFKICEPTGEVQRIVIFRKRGVQAMVEFANIQAAQRAKASLNGADIYSGCCTLKIDWAKPARLNVYKNDDETWDYTVELEQSNNGSSQPALLGDAPAGFQSNFNHQATGGHMSRGGAATARPPPRLMRGDMSHGRPRPLMMGGTTSQQISPEFVEDFGMQDVAAYSSSPVLMIYGLHPEKMNCDRVFNILCLYGNVIKVKFLKSKPGTAMVQMGDPLAVDRAISGLSGMRFFNEKLVLAPSKQMYLTDTSGNVSQLNDGTPTQIDYNSSRNNRFTTTEQAAKNRIQNPSKVLHYYNAPISFDEEQVNNICKELEITPPTKFVPFKSKTERSSSGLMEFDTKAQALECLTVANHYKIDNPTYSRYPYIIKLCFSTSTTTTRQ